MRIFPKPTMVQEATLSAVVDSTAPSSEMGLSDTMTIETLDSSLAMRAGENLLDVLLDSGHAVEYQCRSGYCGACRVKVEQGQVEYDEAPLAHIEADEILPCCCRVSEPLRLSVSLRKAGSEQQGDLFDDEIN